MSEPTTVDACTQVTFYNTTYNSDHDKVLPVAGIMFAMVTKSNPLDVLTIELDVLDSFQEDDVQVYTYQGNYRNVMIFPTQWRLVANTRLVRRTGGGGGALILPDRFDHVTIPANTMQSFFITLKGAWIDSLLNQYDEVGRLDVETADFGIYTGTALLRHGFPLSNSNDYIAAFSPRLAATLHYSIHDQECTAATFDTLTTPILYDFFVNLPVEALQSAESVQTAILSAVQETLTTQLDQDSVLAGHGTHSGLTKDGGALAVQAPYAPCPVNWGAGACSQASVSFVMSHHVTLPSGQLEYEMYSMHTILTEAVQTKLRQLSQTSGNSASVLASYVGYQGVAADYEMILRNVPSGQSMNWRQALYFKQTTTDLLVRSLPTTGPMHLLQMGIAEQRQGVRQLRELQQGGSVAVTGTFFGKQSRFPQVATTFPQQLQAALGNGNALKNDLVFNIMLPKYNAYMNDEEYVFFENVNQVVISPMTEAAPRAFNPITPSDEVDNNHPPPPPRGDLTDPDQNPDARNPITDFGNNIVEGVKDVNNTTWIIVGACVGVVLLLIMLIACYCCHRKRQQQQRKKEQQRRNSHGQEQPRRGSATSRRGSASSSRRGSASLREQDETVIFETTTTTSRQPSSRAGFGKSSRKFNDGGSSHHGDDSETDYSNSSFDPALRPSGSRDFSSSSSRDFAEAPASPRRGMSKKGLSVRPASPASPSKRSLFHKSPKPEKMSVRDLKTELQGMGLDTSNYFDKSEMVEAYNNEKEAQKSSRSIFGNNGKPPNRRASYTAGTPLYSHKEERDEDDDESTAAKSTFGKMFGNRRGSTGSTATAPSMRGFNPDPARRRSSGASSNASSNWADEPSVDNRSTRTGTNRRASFDNQSFASTRSARPDLGAGGGRRASMPAMKHQASRRASNGTTATAPSTRTMPSSAQSTRMPKSQPSRRASNGSTFSTPSSPGNFSRPGLSSHRRASMPNTANPRGPSSAMPSRTPPQSPSRPSRGMAKAQGMSVRDLRTELKGMGVATDGFFEKSELVDAYVKASR